MTFIDLILPTLLKTKQNNLSLFLLLYSPGGSSSLNPDSSCTMIMLVLLRSPSYVVVHALGRLMYNLT